MTPRLASLAIGYRELVLPALVLICVASGYAGTDAIGAHPARERSTLSPSSSIVAMATVARPLPSIAFGSADIASAAGPVTRKPASDTAPAEQAPKPTVTAALTNSSGMLAAEPSIKQEGELNPTDHTASQDHAASPDLTASLGPDLGPDLPNRSAGSPEAVDACPATATAADICTDRYLWALYQRAPKQDSITNRESRTVTIKKKGKLVTVTKIVAVDAEEDFSWKDPKAAVSAGMALMDYVIGGMDRDFKLRLARLLQAAEQAGLSPGITSAFRDDYRQSIANGLKAANNRSYHGGSLRGGYGHGLAADIVSVNGATRAERLASTRILWKWVDAHGKDFGLGRPYLGKDPMHVAPIDGQEWAVHRLGKPDQTPSITKPVAQAAG